jgi:hypothetical protein
MQRYLLALLLLACGVCRAQPQIIYLPPLNLAATETAEVGITSSAAGYVGGAFLTTCNAAVAFYGADGSALGAASDFTIGDDRQIFSARLPYGSSTVVSAQIALTAKGGVFDVLAPPIPVCAVAFALQTLDTATGVTHAFLPGWAAQGITTIVRIGEVSVSPCLDTSLCVPGIPQPGSPQNIVLPPLGFGPTETAQVTLVNTAPSSYGCDGSVSFYDVAGALLGKAASFTLGTGQNFSVKLPYASTGAAGSSTLVRAEIALSLPSTPRCELGFSLETYDSATGITHALVSGTAMNGAATKVLRNGR